MTHQSHPDVVKRLKRSEGHLRKTIQMIEEGRPCTDLAQQLHAVQKAVEQAKKMLIHDHIDHCLNGSASGEVDNKAVVAEFREISKYL
ncbi:MAG: metal-sensing transcriptional repressor [Pseudomonadota bacterium]